MNTKLKTIKRTGKTSSRDRDTACPSTITVAVLPSEQAIKGCQVQIRIDFLHNHPLSSAHVLSFRNVSCDTKTAFLDYFSQGYSPAQATFVHENNLVVHTGDLTSEQHLSDRSTNPRLGDIYSLNAIRQTVVQDKENLSLKGLRLELGNSTKIVERQWAKLFCKGSIQVNYQERDLHLFLLFALLSRVECISMSSRKEG